MKRRTFLRGVGGAIALPMIAGPGKPDAGEKPAHPREKMKRVGATTVCFRSRFPQTRGSNADYSGPDMKLEEVPAFFAEKLGVHNVELWSRHFSDDSLKFCRKLKKLAAKEEDSRIINIQLDADDNLSARDRARRRESVDFVKKWMDRAAACGAGSLRANTGGGRQPFDLSITADSFRQLAEHGKEIGVKILVENHTGYARDPENVVAIVEAVDSPWCRTLPDFGNMPQDLSREKRHAFLKKLMPHAHLISAKGMHFDEEGNHTTYGLGACVRLAESCGFEGIYSAEQWSREPIAVSDLRAARRIIEIIVKNMREPEKEQKQQGESTI